MTGTTEPTDGAVEVPISEPDAFDKRVPSFWQAALLFPLFWAMTIGGWVAFTLVGVLIGTMTGHNPVQTGSAGALTAWMAGCMNLLVFGALIAGGTVWANRPVGEILPFRRFDLRLTLPCAVVAVAFSILLSEADNLLQYYLPAPRFIREMAEEMIGHGAASVFLLVFVAPLTEESFFRGFVLNGFLKRYGVTRAIVLSSLLFAVFHLNPYQFVAAFVLGAVMAWIRIWTGSLWSCIFLHALSNGMIFVARDLLRVRIAGYNATELGHSFQPLWFDAAGVVCAVIGIFLLRAWMGERQG
jgi:membrane protease YdiL (CAAX protease family)